MSEGINYDEDGVQLQSATPTSEVVLSEDEIAEIERIERLNKLIHDTQEKLKEAENERQAYDHSVRPTALFPTKMIHMNPKLAKSGIQTLITG